MRPICNRNGGCNRGASRFLMNTYKRAIVRLNIRVRFSAVLDVDSYFFSPVRPNHGRTENNPSTYTNTIYRRKRLLYNVSCVCVCVYNPNTSNNRRDLSPRRVTLNRMTRYGRDIESDRDRIGSEKNK